MTPAQLTLVKAAILADPVMSQAAMDPPGHQVVQNALNALAVPSFWVYKEILSRHDILTATSSDGTTFTWAGGAYITRSQGERDAFREMFNSTGTVTPSSAPIQAAFQDIFSGAGGASNRAHIAAMSRREATVLEKVLKASGTGSSASPATAGFTGTISLAEVEAIRTTP